MTEEELRKLRDEHAKPEVRIPAVGFKGFSGETVVGGGQQKVQVILKGSKTSLDYDFHTYTNGICQEFGIKPCWNLLIRSNEIETKLYKDNLPRSVIIRAKKPLQAMRVVFENDIVDILGLSFHDGIANINPEPNEKVFCIISKGYTHGLYFDLTGRLDPETFKQEMGFLYREMAYANLYMALDNGIIEKMINMGWFPFVQIIGTESQNLTALISENKTDKIDAWANGLFSNERIKAFTDLWKEHKAYQQKQQQFEAGLKCFFDANYISAITTLTPLIEGSINEYMILKTGKGISYKGDDIAEVIYQNALLKADERSIMLPVQFKMYLVKYFYKHNTSATTDEALRNPVTHGRARDESFTRQRALQILLTIDQLFFYMDK